MNLVQEANWYAVHTKPRREDAAAMNISRLGLQILLPKMCDEKVVFGVRKKVLIPLFRGYLFARFSPNSYLHLIRYARGVHCVVSCGEVPLRVDEEIIRTIQRRVGKRGYVKLKTKAFRPGDRIVVEDGPFQGFEGIFERELSDQERVLILLETIGYQAHLSIEKQRLRPALEAL